jgi:hypothetical protein
MQELYWSRVDVPVMELELCNKDSNFDKSGDVHNGPNLNAFVENCLKNYNSKVTANDKKNI